MWSSQRKAHYIRRYPAALGAAVALLLGSGVGYRLLAARYGALSHRVPLPPGTLAQVPLQIGEWTGRDVPADERIIIATDTDDHLNRTYVRRERRDTVSLWVAYGVRFRDLMPHRPEVCYTGSGWVLDDEKVTEVQTADGSVLPCRILRFHQGGLENRRITVLNYYLVDGQYAADVSALRSQAWRFDRDARYVAQVQVTHGSSPFQDTSEASVRAFTTDAAPVILTVLAEAIDRWEQGSEPDDDRPVH